MEQLALARVVPRAGCGTRPAIVRAFRTRHERGREIDHAPAHLGMEVDTHLMRNLPGKPPRLKKKDPEKRPLETQPIVMWVGRLQSKGNTASLLDTVVAVKGFRRARGFTFVLAGSMTPVVRKPRDATTSRWNTIEVGTGR